MGSEAYMSPKINLSIYIYLAQYIEWVSHQGGQNQKFLFLILYCLTVNALITGIILSCLYLNCDFKKAFDISQKMKYCEIQKAWGIILVYIHN